MEKPVTTNYADHLQRPEQRPPPPSPFSQCFNSWSSIYYLKITNTYHSVDLNICAISLSISISIWYIKDTVENVWAPKNWIKKSHLEYIEKEEFSITFIIYMFHLFACRGSVLNSLHVVNLSQILLLLYYSFLRWEENNSPFKPISARFWNASRCQASCIVLVVYNWRRPHFVHPHL